MIPPPLTRPARSFRLARPVRPVYPVPPSRSSGTGDRPAVSAAWPRILRGLLVVCILLILVVLFAPVFNTTVIRSGQTRELAQAKQIGLALKLYAGDHDGVYPAGTNLYGEKIRTSNDALRSLFPEYVAIEKIFGNQRSAYQVAPPDDVILPAREILRAGENVYSYVMGVTDRMPASTPLIADGTDGTGLGLYVSDPQARGGTWGGGKTIVVRLDNSGALLSLAGPANTRYLPASADPEGKKINQLGPAALGPNLKLLDPAVVLPETR